MFNLRRDLGVLPSCFFNQYFLKQIATRRHPPAPHPCIRLSQLILLRRSAGDKSLLGILCIDLPLDPIGLAPPMAHVQEATSLEFFSALLLPPLVR